jgi:hypothetical protein
LLFRFSSAFRNLRVDLKELFYREELLVETTAWLSHDLVDVPLCDWLRGILLLMFVQRPHNIVDDVLDCVFLEYLRGDTHQHMACFEMFL